MGQCAFCRLNRENNPSVFWTNNVLWYALFSAYPLAPGHAMLVTVRHVKSYLELDFDEQAEFFNSLEAVSEELKEKDLEQVYRRMLEKPIDKMSESKCRRMLLHPGLKRMPDGYSHYVSDGNIPGRAIDHLQWHIIPRFRGDVKDSHGDISYLINRMESSY